MTSSKGLIVYRLASGQSVCDWTISNKISAELRTFLPEVIGKIYASHRHNIAQEIDLGRNVGLCACVPTTDSDEIVFARRTGRRGQSAKLGLSRFVKNRQPIPTTKITVIIRKERDRAHYVLIAAFFGPKAEPEVWDRPTPKSMPFWHSHAFVWGSPGLEIVPGSETSEYPWNKTHARR